LNICCLRKLIASWKIEGDYNSLAIDITSIKSMTNWRELMSDVKMENE
jgi:hypothetical protein